MKRKRPPDRKPSRASSDECAEGHPLVGNNVVWGVSRGRAYRRCRQCRNAYHAAKNKEVRQGEHATALKILRNVAEAPGRFPRELVSDVLALAAEIRTKVEAARARADRRPFDFSKAIRNPFAARAESQKTSTP